MSDFTDSDSELARVPIFKPELFEKNNENSSSSAQDRIRFKKLLDDIHEQSKNSNVSDFNRILIEAQREWKIYAQGNVKFKCEDCGKEFAKQTYLNRHRKHVRCTENKVKGYKVERDFSDDGYEFDRDLMRDREIMKGNNKEIKKNTKDSYNREKERRDQKERMIPIPRKDQQYQNDWGLEDDFDDSDNSFFEKIGKGQSLFGNTNMYQNNQNYQNQNGHFREAPVKQQVQILIIDDD